VPEELYEVFEEPSGYIDEKNPGPDIPLSLEEFMNEMRDTKPNARTFGLKLKSMVHCLIISF
jgi:galacturonosyltransferase 12/13/14/15